MALKYNFKGIQLGNSKSASRHVKTIKTIFELQRRSILEKQTPPQLGKWLSQEFQQLGPTYIKIGQFIYSRKDIFGKEFSQPFECLRNAVIPVDTDDYVIQVLKENGCMNKFSYVEKKPLAAASISQVHRAKLKNGDDVVIKVRRPDIISNVTDDIMFLRTIVEWGKHISPNKDNVEQSVKMLNDFENLIKQETDFELEVQNIKKFTKSLDALSKQPFKAIVVPKVYEELCNNEIIVMSYIPSRMISEQNKLVNRKDLALNMMRFFIKQVVDHGIVHGDPHEGNLGITPDGELVIYDFGNIIEISRKDRQLFKELVYLLVFQNNKGAIRTLEKLGVKVLDKAVMNDYLNLYVDYIKTLDIDLIYSSHNPNAKLPLVLNDKIFRLIRVFSILEGVCKKLNKSFSYLDLLDEYTALLFVDLDFMMYKATTDMESLVSLEDYEYRIQAQQDTMKKGNLSSVNVDSSQNNNDTNKSTIQLSFAQVGVGMVVNAIMLSYIVFHL